MKQETDKKIRVKVPILVKLVAMSVLPLIAITVTVLVVSSRDMTIGMQEQLLGALKGEAYSYGQIYEAMDSGDYQLDKSGVLYKGDVCIEDDYTVEDNIKKETGFDVTLFFGDERKATSVIDDAGKRAVKTKASDTVIQDVLKDGKDFSSTKADVNGMNYYAYYLPLKNKDGSIVGMLFAGKSSADVDAYIQEKQMNVILISAVVLLLVLFLTMIISRSLSHAVREAEETIDELSNGNLRVEINRKYEKRNDELGLMLRTLNHFQQKLKDVMGTIKNSAAVLLQSGDSLDNMAVQSNTTTIEIHKAVEEISRGAVIQAEEIDAASTSINDMGDMISGIAQNAEGLDNSSEDMKKASDESQNIIQALNDSNDRTTEAMQKIGKQVHTTNDSVQTIRQAVDLISEIASETNLLSLNASIEAARAGEHGRGFSIVASEIQKLAEQSNHSAVEIGQVIDELLKESETTVTVMDQVTAIVLDQQEKLHATKEQFAKVTEGVNSSRREVSTIKEQTGICDKTRGRIDEIIQNLSAVSQENTAETEETNASMQQLNESIEQLAGAAKELRELAVSLDSNMEFFQI